MCDGPSAPQSTSNGTTEDSLEVKARRRLTEMVRRSTRMRLLDEDLDEHADEHVEKMVRAGQ